MCESKMKITQWVAAVPALLKFDESLFVYPIDTNHQTHCHPRLPILTMCWTNEDIVFSKKNRTDGFLRLELPVCWLCGSVSVFPGRYEFPNERRPGQCDPLLTSRLFELFRLVCAVFSPLRRLCLEAMVFHFCFVSTRNRAKW